MIDKIKRAVRPTPLKEQVLVKLQQDKTGLLSGLYRRSDPTANYDQAEAIAARGTKGMKQFLKAADELTQKKP